VTLLRECLELAIRLAVNEVALAHWWGEHQAALKLLPRDDLALVLAAKERRRAEWRAEARRRAEEDRARPKASFL